MQYTCCSCDSVPVVDSGSSSRFGQCFFWIAAQTCTDTTGLSSTPRCIETHPKHEEHCYHVEQPGEGEKETNLNRTKELQGYY